MKEEEIRPKAILDQYLKLSAEDGAKLDKNLFQECVCQACGGTRKETKFEKHGYTYKMCLDCHSLFCSPRPTPDQISSLYFNSPSSTFWSNVFFPSVRDARREKLFKPKAKKIANLIKEKGLAVKTVCDIGAGHGLFLEELQKEIPGLSLFAVEPDSTSAEVCRSKGIETLVSTAEDAKVWRNKFDLVLCSEVVEHVHNVKNFVSSVHSLVRSGGHYLITGLGYDGFDILTLQDKSKAVSPPHHLNFLSVEGFNKLFILLGARSVEVWTPGQLDVDIVINSGIENEFIRVLKARGDSVVREFQEFLARNQLSSHTWILVQK
ncbi:SAM-dependent methyltransferase [Bdellovibrio bacteriovorus]|uniref:SAM-dependent methyltransferase n=1 Tax=Bdellovibrio bacteriovorus TaxID=959 RepID=A0A150WLC8_BDEBC|nr:class I SAM-dependent methyltransferase [Bdellovibrio bacteriovorus]KYG64744.1 SAM-dependent methyltransferase [Bdellovibrio bacteriovorus]